MEKKFMFRERLVKVHKENIRNYDLKAQDNDFEIFDEVVISLPEVYEKVMLTAANDFKDYLFTSMNLSSRIGNDGDIIISHTLAKDNDKDCFEINISDKIYINSTDSRTAAQALYYLEDLMNERKAPLLKKGTIKKTMAFSPRMMRTSYMPLNKIPIVDPVSEEYLAIAAHHGFNAILLSYGGLDYQLTEHMDKILESCEKYGIDVYFNSDISSKYHPDDPGGREYYESTYGAVMDRFPKIKGIVLVGESIGFPSKDPNTCGHRFKSPDRIPSKKADSGFYPCKDFYTLVNCIKDVVRKRRSDADIIFWTYNFYAYPIETRREMIEKLPTDISFLVTFELSHQYEHDGITKLCSDYTISRPGPCRVFEEEAKVAKERGLRLYSMTSTSGSTWDFGTIPYMPMPQKWIKRYKAMFKAQDDYNLSGMLEAWSYGFYPSVVSELAKKCFMDRDSDFDENLRIILKNHFGKDADTVYKALDLWSEASDYIHASHDEQYGPLRIGTAYSLALLTDIKPPMASPWYKSYHGHGASALQSLYAVRDEVETKHWKKMSELMKEGADLLKTIENPSEELSLLENLGRYIYHCVVTVVNVHRWHKLRDWIDVEKDKTVVKEIIEEMRKVAADEIQNARASIDCLRKDSKLGYETHDSYVGHEEAVLWKIKYTEYMLEKELTKYERELDFL